MRRRYGVGDIQKQQATTTKFKAKSEAITKEQIEKLTEQMETFKTFLETFASKHREQIRDNPEFRRQFLLMCATVGVDPLQSTNNFWTKFSGVGVFYIELAVQVVEVCKATTPQNGGLITIEELLRRVKLSRKSVKHKKEDISIDDILRCIDKISVLGNGIKVFKFNKSYIIQSVPKELTLDHTEIVKLAQSKNGYIHKVMVMKELNWEENRFFRIINDMIMEGLVWLDKQSSEASILYWFPGLLLPSQMR